MSASALRRAAFGEPLLAVLLPILSALLILGVWQGLVMMAHVPEVILPPPSAILREFFAAFPELVHHARFTAAESIAAFVIATILGVGIAACVSLSPAIREMVLPNLILFQLIPKIALAPLFIVWLGVGSPARLAFGVFVSFFPIALSTMTGLVNTDLHALKLCQSLGATRGQIFLKVRVPFALPHLLTGMKVAATLVFIGIVVGEFISSSAGLGYFILNAGARSETAKIFAGLAALSLLGLAFYGLIVLAEQAARRWWRG